MRTASHVTCQRFLPFSACLLILALAGEAISQSRPADFRKAAASEPPYKRLLKGEDAKKVEGLEKKITELRIAGKYVEAQAAAREILAIRTRVQGKDHWETGDARRLLQTLEQIEAMPKEAQRDLSEAVKQDGEAQKLFDRGKYAQAVPIARRAFELRRRHLGMKALEVASASIALGYALSLAGKYAEAEPLLRKALAIYQKTLGEENPDTATNYNNIAANLYFQGKYAEAEPLYRKALAICQKVLGEEQPRTATSYNNLAANLYFQGKYAEAEPLYRKALAIWQKALGEEHPSTATSYNNVAENLEAQGKYAEAEPLFRKALAICQKVLGEEHPDTATSYNALAVNMNAQGQYAEAEPLYRHALAIWQKALGEEHPNTATSYYNVAFNLNSQGKYAEAEPLLHKALAIYQKALGEEHPFTATSHYNVAFNLNSQGKYAEAEPLLRKALAIYQKVLGEEHPYTATSYNSLAFNLNAESKYAEAETLLRKALAIDQKVLGEEHPDTATSYNALAFNLKAESKYAEAETMATKAAASFNAARLRISFTGLERATYGTERSPLPLLARNGKPAEAWQRLEENLARGLLDDLAARNSRPLNTEERSREQAMLGQLQNLDKRITALMSARKGPAARRQQVVKLRHKRQQLQAELAQFQADLEKKYGVRAGQVNASADIQKHLPADAALIAWLDLKGAAKAADPNDEHWAFVLRRRGAPACVRLAGTGCGGGWTEADSALPGKVRRQLDKPLEAPEERLRQLAAQRLSPLEECLRGGPELPPVKHLIILPSPWMAGIPVETLTGSYSVSYAPSGTMFAWLQEEHKAGRKKAAGTNLLALGDPSFRRAETPAPPLPAPPDHGVLATAVLPGSNAAHSGLKPGDVLLSYAGTKLSVLADLQAALGQAAGQQTAGTSRGPGSIPVQLWRAGQTMNLAVRPGKLGLVFAKERPALALRQQREAEAILRRSLRGPSFKPLPGTRREVEALARLFGAQGGHVEKLLGSDASEQNLEQLATKDALKQFRYLHLATHGKPDPKGGLHSFLALAQDRLPDPLDLSAVDRPSADGRLTAEEILRTWKLNADLVTLSACETALGQQQGGEGYVGFAQALFLAGARSLVLSLWQVDDRATALLMTRFYQNLLGKREGLEQPLGKAASLAEAKRWLRSLDADEASRLLKQMPGAARGEEVALPASVEVAHPYEHPYYWAAFILIGDPGDVTEAVPVLARKAPPGTTAAAAVPGQAKASSYAWLWAIGGVLAALALGFLTIRRVRRQAD